MACSDKVSQMYALKDRMNCIGFMRIVIFNILHGINYILTNFRFIVKNNVAKQLSNERWYASFEKLVNLLFIIIMKGPSASLCNYKPLYRIWNKKIKSRALGFMLAL